MAAFFAGFFSSQLGVGSRLVVVGGAVVAIPISAAYDLALGGLEIVFPNAHIAVVMLVIFHKCFSSALGLGELVLECRTVAHTLEYTRHTDNPRS